MAAMRLAHHAVVLVTYGLASSAGEPGYTILKNTDFVGNDIPGSKVTTSIEDCAQLCKDTAYCVAASWNAPGSHFNDLNCNLKCAGEERKTDAGEIGIIFRTESQCGQRPYKILQDTDFFGHDIVGSAKVSSVEKCAELCKSKPGCLVAVWNSPSSSFGDGNCNLKCSHGVRSSKSGELAVVLRDGNQCAPPAPQRIPEDLGPAYDAGDLLWTSDEAGVKYRPEIGNGFVATVAGSEDVYTAGVFNGCLGNCHTNPSRRARIPAPLKLVVKASVTGAALDVRNGAYLRRYAVGGDAVQLRFYAHRVRRSLLVAEVSANVANGGDVTFFVEGAGGSSPKSNDFDFSVSELKMGGQRLTVWNGVVKEVETQSTVRTRVAVVFASDGWGEMSLSSGSSRAFLAATRTSLESDDPEAEAVKDYMAAAALNAHDLYSEHTAAWSKLWESGFEVAGRMDVARAVNSSLYFLLSSIREDAVYSLSPGGLASNGYNGHTFWDCEIWMYPSMVLWHPEIAKSLLQYRIDRVSEAEKKAISYQKGYKGVMFPWESAATGAEECPSWAATGVYEQHITADIAIAARQLWYAHRDKKWLSFAFPTLVNQTANFWVSRVEWDSDKVAHINDVIPPDEYAKGDDSVYTNYVAQRNLIFAKEASRELGERANPEWERVAQAIPLSFDTSKGIHPEYTGYNGQKIKQADVILLGFPLMMDMSPEVRRADLDYYAPRTDSDGPAMTWAMHAIGYLEVQDKQKASDNFDRAFANAQAPFGVWSETPTGGAVNFITGVGGFLQAALFGLSGLRILPDRLALKPFLVKGMAQVKIRGVHYQGSVFDLSFDDVKTTLKVASGALMIMETASGKESLVESGTSVTIDSGEATITATGHQHLII
eukprot:TRINITY_DN23056_c0_g1_i2.p1 TRINITY_DN23056_c0_g1~~TRINITY_DN23056_c0_g1_i2.p1  ORF type:complete len:881 (+),score=121.14 TRINITY_DN23056_c0_g1_i2:76-2718(+)